MYAVLSSCIALKWLDLACELRLRQARNFHAHREDASGLRQPRELFRIAPLPRARYIEGLEIRAAERAHRRAQRRQRVLGDELAARRETNHFAAAVNRAPVAAFAVDGGSVGPVAFNEQPLIGDRPTPGLEVPRMDLSGRSVAVIHRARIRTPGQTVGDHDSWHHCRELEIRIEAVQVAGA